MKTVYLEGNVYWLMKNGPPTFHKIVTKAFKEYLDNFIKTFIDYFIVYNDIDTHL